MKTTCEICGKETKDQVSYLELETWEFNFLKKENKDFYSICFNCFDKHTNNFIDQEMDLELRKKRSRLVNREVQEEIEAILEIEN
ncbi:MULTISPECIES: hypothetical protein [Planococcus]|uniref:Uncharacterized protein n=2 Tax=Planococcus TaxID=1372 RepID=A0ABN4JVU7_9BACL|nr:MULTISPECIES: hypothetical protein [Planococcus]ALS78437.1 hypothetical protein AUO94_07065 [Planococcus kocurii]AQU79583.1 hypothetical protein AJGP001_10080 [Planococcus faecalis]OHX53199.1 hypothetical protein BB777_11135 [Planococcus faecalis]